MTYDPNAGDLQAVTEELAFAERLGPRWKAKIVMVPLHSYGVEWAVIDPETEELNALLFFEHGKDWSKDRPYTVRASRIVNGGKMALTLKVPLLAVIMRGKEGTRYARFPDAKSMAEAMRSPWAVREVRDGVYESWLEVGEDILKSFKETKDE